MKANTEGVALLALEKSMGFTPEQAEVVLEHLNITTKEMTGSGKLQTHLIAFTSKVAKVVQEAQVAARDGDEEVKDKTADELARNLIALGWSLYVRGVIAGVSATAIIMGMHAGITAEQMEKLAKGELEPDDFLP